MCGIAGFIDTRTRRDDQEMRRIASIMASSLAHRGPDDSGVWVESTYGVALAHRRLSILDISSAGHQPMISPSGRYVIVFNGEIYNHLELREEVRGFSPPTMSPFFDCEVQGSWRGFSDTETLLSCIELWGFESTLKKAVGMFAIAMWDCEERVLYLARDRMGEKPLYYGWQKGVFLFGSELKALKAHPAFDGVIDRDALTLLLQYNYIPGPYSIYKGIRKLPPGAWVRIDVGPHAQSGSQAVKEGGCCSYWSLNDVVTAGVKDPFLGNDTDAIETLDGLLQGSVRQQMVADVQLGAFLSGGIDSSTVVALMQSQSDRPVKSFTIGFNEEGYNEAEHAKSVARHLGTEHTELYLSPKQALDVIPMLPTFYDEPFSDSSQIATFLISQITRQHVTVALSGDAGDELFGGYNRYFAATRLFRKFDWMPGPVRQALAAVLNTASVDVWDKLGRLGRIAQGPEKIRKVIEILGARNLESVYGKLVSYWKQPSEIVIGASEPLTILTSPNTWPQLADIEHCMMYLDTMSYLPDDIMVKVDRAAMGVSLETRAPFLDHRVVEFAWRLPLSMKIRNGQGKWILRQVLNKYIPKGLIERPKMGFGVPIDTWLRGPLRDWAEDLLNESRLRHEGFFRPEPIRQKWAEHLSGRRNWQYHLWSVLMFQAWLENS